MENTASGTQLSPTEKPRRKKGRMQRGHQQALMSWMETRIGLHTTLQDMEDALAHKFDPPATAGKLGQAATRLVNHGILRRAGKGIYIYNPHDSNQKQEASDSHLYETVGNLSDGTPVVRSDDGQLFAIIQLEAKIRGQA